MEPRRSPARPRQVWSRGPRLPGCRALGLGLGLLHGAAIAISTFAQEQSFPVIPDSSAEDRHAGRSCISRAVHLMGAG